MELKITSDDQSRFSAQMARVMSDPNLSDAEIDEIIESAVTTVTDKIPGADGLTDTQREMKQNRDRRAEMALGAEQFAGGELGADNDVDDIVFADDDEDGEDEPGPHSGGLETADDGSVDIDTTDTEGPGLVDDDGGLPWRVPKPPPLDVPEDVSAVRPGVSDEGAARKFDNPDGTHRYVESDDPEDWVEKKSKLTSLLNSWSGLPPVIRLGAPLAAVFVVMALVLSMCKGGAAPKPAAGPDPAPPPMAESSEPVNQTVVLQPDNVTDWCPARSTSSTFAFTEDKSKAWVCIRDMGADYGRIEIDFGKPVVVQSIKVIPGWDYVEPNGLDHWSEHRLVTAIDWRLGGKLIKQRIDPTRVGSTLAVDNIATQTMAGTVLKSDAPPADPNNGGPLVLGANTKVDESWAIGKIIISGYVPGGDK